ncbi:putative reverse transcriptase domain-containing protein [Tanacetum coccineum]
MASPDYVPGPEEPEQAPLSPDYVPGPENPEYLAPSDEEVPVEDQPYAVADSPIALSPGYVADSDPEKDLEEDSKDGPVDYPADGGDGNDDDSSDNDEEEEEALEEEDDEHLSPADSVVAPVVDHVPSSEKTEPLETDESAATPPACRTTARISIRPKAPIPFPSEEEVERLLALPPPPPSPLISLSPPSAEERLARCLAAPALPSSPLPIVPHPYGSPNHVRAPPGFRAAMGRLRASSPSTHHPLHPSPPLPPPPSSLHLPPHVPTSLPLPSSPLPASLFIPPPVDRREDTPEAELPPRKRLCLTALTSRYEVGESSTAAPRPAGGHGIDYGFIGTLDAKTRRQRAEEVGYGIRDTWVDPREAAEEIAPVTLEGVNTRLQEQDTQDIYAVIEDAQDRQTRIFQSVETLIDDRQYHYETARLLDQEALVSREAWAHSMGLSSAVHYELQGYRTHAWMQDHRIDAQDSLIAALTAQVSSLQGHLAMTLGEIRALQARDQARADAPEGTASTAVGLVFSFLVSDNHNNMPPRRSSATARAAAAAAAPMTAAAVEQLIEARVSDDSQILPNGEIKKLEIELWNLKVKGTDITSYTLCFQKLALMCGRMFPEELDEVEKYVGGLPDMIWGNGTNNRTRGRTLGRAYTAGPGEKREYTGSLPLCTKCNYHHKGPCAPRCNKCKKIGHLAHDCRSSGPNGNNNNRGNSGTTQNAGTCYECGVQGHFKRDCPKLKNKNHGNQGGNGNAPAKVYVVGNAGTNPDSNVVTGTFLLNNRYASILFDTGADRSFVSTTFSSLIDITPTTLDHYYDVELADGKIIGINTIIRGCTLNFLDHPFNINLMPVELGSFDVIIGMDWLAKYHAVIDCAEKIVRIPWGNETLIIHGDGSNQGNGTRLNIISCTKTHKYLLKGHHVFLAHVTTKEIEDKSGEKRLEDVPIVRDFPEVFPEDLSGLPDKYGYIKNHKKTVKNGQTRTRETEYYPMVKIKGLFIIKGPRTIIQVINSKMAGLIMSNQALSLAPWTQRCTREAGFCTNSSHKRSTYVSITDCQAGNPCEFICDPRATIDSQMIDGMIG